jgi:hypothetical protein
VGGAPVAQGAQYRATFESCMARPRREQGLPDGVLGILERPESLDSSAPQLLVVQRGQHPERLAVPGTPPVTSGPPCRLFPLAVFMASDKASGMAGTSVNLTLGSMDD